MSLCWKRAQSLVFWAEDLRVLSWERPPALLVLDGIRPEPSTQQTGRNSEDFLLEKHFQSKIFRLYLLHRSSSVWNHRRWSVMVWTQTAWSWCVNSLLNPEWSKNSSKWTVGGALKQEWPGHDFLTPTLFTSCTSGWTLQLSLVDTGGNANSPLVFRPCTGFWMRLHCRFGWRTGMWCCSCLWILAVCACSDCSRFLQRMHVCAVSR